MHFALTGAPRRRVQTLVDALPAPAHVISTAPASAGREQASDGQLFAVPSFSSSWDDLLHGVSSKASWDSRREDLKARYLRLLRDSEAPPRVDLALRVEEEAVVDGAYRRQLISYAVEADERAHAYLGLPLLSAAGASQPAVVALHGTYDEGLKQAAALVAADGQNPESPADKGYLDHLCRRGFIVIAPEHFVSCFRQPAAGSYDTSEFHRKHPDWTAVGKFTFEHSIAVDVLCSEHVPNVDVENIGVMGHSLGGHGAFFLAAYDDRIRCCVSNCAATFFRHNDNVLQWARDHWYVYFRHLREGFLAGKMPEIDFHEIIALIAPRAFLDLSGLNDGQQLTQRQRLLMLAKIMEVYELHERPENMAFFVHGQGHAIEHDSRKLIYAWMEKHLKPKRCTSAQLVEG